MKEIKALLLLNLVQAGTGPGDLSSPALQTFKVFEGKPHLCLPVTLTVSSSAKSALQSCLRRDRQSLA